MAYRAQFRVVAIVEVPVDGETFEAATENARKVQHSRLVLIKGEYVHGGHTLIGLSHSQAWDDEIVPEL